MATLSLSSTCPVVSSLASASSGSGCVSLLCGVGSHGAKLIAPDSKPLRMMMKAKLVVSALLLASILASCGAPVVVTGRTCIGDSDNCFTQECEVFWRDEGETVCEVSFDDFDGIVRQDAWVTYRGQTASGWAEVDAVAGEAEAGACLDTAIWDVCVSAETEEGSGEGEQQ
jgi:hypothetical protein